MQLILAEGTSPAHLDGTTTGIVVMVIVMLIALAFFIGLIYWAARDPADTKSHRRTALGQGPGGAAGRPVAKAGGQGAPHILVDHDEGTSGS